jgi:hypothetical protein
LGITFAALAQDAVPGEILQRTVLIKAGNQYGTGFTVDYQGRLYLVTAKHFVVGLPDHDAAIKFQRSGQWHDVHTLRTLYPASSDVDIAVFETEETASKLFGIAPSNSVGGVTTSLGMSDRHQPGTLIGIVRNPQRTTPVGPCPGTFSTGRSDAGHHRRQAVSPM